MEPIFFHFSQNNDYVIIVVLTQGYHQCVHGREKLCQMVTPHICCEDSIHVFKWFLKQCHASYLLLYIKHKQGGIM